MQGADYNKRERSEAKRIGAKPHKNSGRGEIQKGDMSNEQFVIDAKFAFKSFTLNESVWAKVCTDAMKVDRSKDPMLYLVIGEGAKTVRLAVVEYSVLEDLINGKNDS